MASTRLDQVVSEEHGPLHYMPWSLSRSSLAQRRWLSTSVAFLHLPVDPNKYGLNASFNRGMKRISHSYKQSYTYLEYSNSKYHLFGFEAPRSFGWIGKNKHIETENCVTQVILLCQYTKKSVRNRFEDSRCGMAHHPLKCRPQIFGANCLLEFQMPDFPCARIPLGSTTSFSKVMNLLKADLLKSK